MTALAFSPNGVQKSTLSNVIEEWFSNDSIRQGNYKIPSTNILDYDDKYVIELSVPGYSKEAFNMQVEGNQLSISTTASSQEIVDQETYKLREFSKKHFTKSFHISDDINIENISAICKDGILSIDLPKIDEAKPQPPKVIKIK